MSTAAARIQVGGALIPFQHVYITRREDDLLLELLLDRQFCNILTSRQMGKSSLMQRTAFRLRDRGVAVATMDISGEIGQEPDQEVAWRTIIDKVADDLGLDCDVDAWWAAQPQSSNNRALLRFFREVVCARVTSPIVIFLDEIDSTFRLPYADDLFTALRTIYNERATDEAYRRLTFCVVGVATPNDLVKDRSTTAYNIGTTIPLRDFEDADEAPDGKGDDLSPLRAVLGVPDAEARPLLKRILYWTGGHPFLTAMFCQALAGKSVRDVDAYVESRYTDLRELRTDVHFAQILRFIDERMKKDVALEALAILERIIRGRPEPDRPTAAHAQLKLSGIVKPNRKAELVIRNRIYARLFDKAWLRSLLPRRKLMWLRRTAIAAICTLLVFIAGALYFFRSYVPGKAAAEYEKRLLAATSLREAKEYRAILAGERVDPVTHIRLHRAAEANAAYRTMSEKWIAEHLGRADAFLAADRIEQGLLLAAFVAEESGQPLAPRYETAFRDRGYEDLVTTLRSASDFWPGLAVSADGHNVAIGNMWWMERGDRWTGVKLEMAASINTVAFGANDHLFTGDDDGVITEWWVDATMLRNNAKTVVEGKPRVLDLVVDARDRPAVIAEGDDEPALKIGDAAVFTTPESPAAIAVMQDGRSIVTVAGSVLTVWTENGRRRLRYTAPDKVVFRDVAVASDGTIAIAEPRSVALFAPGTPFQQKWSLPQAPPVRSVALSSTRLATASDEGARVFDLQAGRDLGLALGDAGDRRGSTVQAVAFDEKQNRLIVRRRDSIQVWSLGGKSDSGGTRLDQWQRKFGLTVTPGGDIQ